MLVMALNCGSATLKYQIYDTLAENIIVQGNVEKIGLQNSSITQKIGDDKEKQEILVSNHTEAMGVVNQFLNKAGIDIAQIKAVGHRVVQGGEKYKSSVLIDDSVVLGIEDLAVLAPLHNPANLMGIRAARDILPDAPQVAVFDTAFHQTMPELTYRYSVPSAWYKDLGVRKYGFHGTSHLYVSKRAARMLGKPARDVNMISLHIGSGASACAIKNGISYDTSMGMTPLCGLSMGLRVGDIDSGAVLYVMERLGKSAAEMTSILGKESGHHGLCSRSDRRDLVDGYNSDPFCKLALDIEALNVKRYIGAYLAELGQIDAISFTAGVGENNAFIRSQMMSGLEHFGINIDRAKNDAMGSTAVFTGVPESDISGPDAKIKVLVIPTNEEKVIIEDTIAIMNGTYNPNHLDMNYSFI